MSLANISLSKILPPLIVKLADGRKRITRRWVIEADTKLNSDQIESQCFDRIGTLDSASWNGNAAPTYKTFATAVLTEQEVRESRIRAGETEPANKTLILEKTYEEAPTTPTQLWPDQPITGPDGIMELNAEFVQQAGQTYTPSSMGGVVGTSTHNGGVLKSERLEVTLAVRTIKRVYVVSGLFQAILRMRQNEGIALVTFKSIGATKIIPTGLNGAYAMTDPVNLAFQGGAAALIWQDDIVDIAGLRTYEVTAVLKYDGSVIAASGSTTVRSFYDYIEYALPGKVDCDSTLATTFLLTPPTPRAKLKVLITEVITDSNDPGSAPFFVTQWCKATYTYTPTATGVAKIINKALVGFLAGASLAVTSGNVGGEPAVNIVGTVDSTPSYGSYSTSGKTIDLRLAPAFLTAYGVQYYRKRTVVAQS